MAVRGTERIYACVPSLAVTSILDVGMGTGEASLYFKESGLDVVSLDRSFNGGYYEPRVETLYTLNKKVRGDALEIPFQDESFDAVWASHIIEHTINPGIMLKEFHRVLKPNGWLLAVVPPFQKKVVSGHYMTGWTVGMLIYVLLVSGYHVKDGRFVQYENNVCGFVRKSDKSLPKLHDGRNDIENLKDYWPFEVKGNEFMGDFPNGVNWEWSEEYVRA